MKLHRDLGVTQRTAWFMLQRIREALAPLQAADLEGPVEADEPTSVDWKSTSTINSRPVAAP